MGRFEKKIRKRLEKSTKPFDEWYEDNRERFPQMEQESVDDISGFTKAKKRYTSRYWIMGLCVLLALLVIMTSIMLSKNSDNSSMTFGDDEVYSLVVDEQEISDVFREIPYLAKIKFVDATEAFLRSDKSLVMRTVNGELETENNLYLITARIQLNDNYLWLGKSKHEGLQNKTAINGIEISYEFKNVDGYGLNQYYMLTQSDTAKIYWDISCYENTFVEFISYIFE